MASNASLILRYLVLGSASAEKSLERNTKKTTELGTASQRTTRSQQNLAKASNSASRQFSAQANGLGGLVAAYAGAAANIFALQQAFSALNRAAQVENIITGTRTLAAAVGASGDEIISTLRSITKEQLTLAETAESANLGLASGFGAKQLTEITEVATKASRALGRNLTDSLQRLFRGAAKLEPELLDELGIFTRIEPAARAYADQIGKAASQLTRFEKQQAFINAVIDEGQRKFRDIDVSSTTAQSALEKLGAQFVDLATKFGTIISSVLLPFVEFINNNMTAAIISLGLVGALVFGKFASLVGGAFDNFSANLIDSANNLTIFVSRLNTDFDKAGAAIDEFVSKSSNKLKFLAGDRVISTEVTKFVNELKKGDVPLTRLEEGQRAIKEQVEATNQKLRENEAIRQRILKSVRETGTTSASQKKKLTSLDNSDRIQKQNKSVLEGLDIRIGDRFSKVNKSADKLTRKLRGIVGFVKGAGKLVAVFARFNVIILSIISTFDILNAVFGKIFGQGIIVTITNAFSDLIESFQNLSRSVESFAFQSASKGREAIDNLGVSAKTSRLAIERLNKEIKSVFSDTSGFRIFTLLFGADSPSSFRSKTLKELDNTINAIKKEIAEAVDDNDFGKVAVLDATLVGLEETRADLKGIRQDAFAFVRAIENLEKVSGTTGSETFRLIRDNLRQVGDTAVLSIEGINIAVGKFTDSGELEKLSGDIIRVGASYIKLTNQLVSGDLAASQLGQTVLALRSGLESLGSSSVTEKVRVYQQEMKRLAEEIQKQEKSITRQINEINNLLSRDTVAQQNLAPFIGTDGVIDNVQELRAALPNLINETNLALKRQGVSIQGTVDLYDDLVAEQSVYSNGVINSIQKQKDLKKLIESILPAAEDFANAFSAASNTISQLNSKLGTFNNLITEGRVLIFDIANALNTIDFSTQAAIGLNIQKQITTLKETRETLLNSLQENFVRQARSKAEFMSRSQQQVAVEENLADISQELKNLDKIRLGLAFELLEAAQKRTREIEKELKAQQDTLTLMSLEKQKSELEGIVTRLQERLQEEKRISDENEKILNFSLKIKEIQQQILQDAFSAEEEIINQQIRRLEIEGEIAATRQEAAERELKNSFRIAKLRNARRAQFLSNFENFGSREDRFSNQEELIKLETQEQLRLIKLRKEVERENLARELKLLDLERDIVESQIAAIQAQIEAEKVNTSIRQAIISEQIRAAKQEKQTQTDIIAARISTVRKEEEIARTRVELNRQNEVQQLEILKLQAENDIKFLESFSTALTDFLTELASTLSDATGKTITAEAIKPQVDNLRNIPNLLQAQIDGVNAIAAAEQRAIKFTFQERVNALSRERFAIRDQIENRLKELRRQSALESAASDQRRAALEAEIDTLQENLELNDLQKEAVIAAAEERLAALDAEQQRVQDNHDLQMRNLDQQRDVLRQLADDISAVLKDKIGQGIQDLSKAYFDGTLTRENFKEGVINLYVDILDGIREKVTDQLIVKPVEDLIGSAFDDLFGIGAKKDGSTPDRALYTQDVSGAGVVSQAEEVAREADSALTETIENNKNKTTSFMDSIFGSDGILSQGLRGIGDLGAKVFTGIGDILTDVFSNVSGGSSSGGLFGTLAGGFGSLFGGGSSAATSTATSIASNPSVVTSFNSSALLPSFASGGLVSKMAQGGPTMLRDRVPALLEPGEFVMNKRASQDIGLDNLRSMNGTGGGSPNVSVNITNNGTPQETEGQPNVRFDGKQFVIDVVLKDLRNNGPIRQGIRGNT